MRRLLLTLALLVLPAGCCSLAADAAGQTLHLDHQGQRRSALLVAPPDHRPGQAAPRPLLLALHGGLGSGALMRRMSALDGPAGAAGAWVVYPDGLDRAWNAGRCCGPPMQQQVDDVGFLRALVEAVAARVAIDRERIWGTGFSNGAMLLQRAACEAPGLFQAIAPVAGGRMTDACPARQGPASLLIQGLEDARIPWAGGTFQGSPRPSMAAMAQQWGERNGCAIDTPPQALPDQGPARCWQWAGCAAGRPVRWCGLAGVGHQWPGGETVLPRLLGANTAAWSASQQVVDFFRALPTASAGAGS